MRLKRENFKMVGKLGVIVLGMFAFGYALVTIYKAICEMTGINVLALSDRQIPGATPPRRNNGPLDDVYGSLSRLLFIHKKEDLPC